MPCLGYGGGRRVINCGLAGGERSHLGSGVGTRPPASPRSHAHLAHSAHTAHTAHSAHAHSARHDASLGLRASTLSATPYAAHAAGGVRRPLRPQSAAAGHMLDLPDGTPLRKGGLSTRVSVAPEPPPPLHAHYLQPRGAPRRRPESAMMRVGVQPPLEAQHGVHASGSPRTARPSLPLPRRAASARARR